jgi:hypothetical protein
MDLNEAVLVKEFMDRHLQRVTHPEDRAECTRPRPQVRNRAQKLE